MKTQIDDIPLFIQRPKQTETPETKIPDGRTIDDILILLEKHERRIELLEDELHAIAGRDNR
jgi:hypothetical protein